MRRGEGVFDGAQGVEPLVALLVGKEAFALGVGAGERRLGAHPGVLGEQSEGDAVGSEGEGGVDKEAVRDKISSQGWEKGLGDEGLSNLFCLVIFQSAFKLYIDTLFIPGEMDFRFRTCPQALQVGTMFVEGNAACQYCEP